MIRDFGNDKLFGIKNLFNKIFLVNIKDFLICNFVISFGIFSLIKKFGIS